MTGVLPRLVYAVTGVAPARQRYGRTDFGKPVLLYPEGWHVGLSHSGGREAAVVSRRPAGVDMERIRPYHTILARRVFTPDECLRIENAKNPDAEYTRLWTLRESQAKCTGQGMKGVMALAGKPLPDGFLWRSEVKGGYIMTVCLKK